MSTVRHEESERGQGELLRTWTAEAAAQGLCGSVGVEPLLRDRPLKGWGGGRLAGKGWERGGGGSRLNSLGRVVWKKGEGWGEGEGGDPERTKRGQKCAVCLASPRSHHRGESWPRRWSSRSRGSAVALPLSWRLRCPQAQRTQLRPACCFRWPVHVLPLLS